MTVAVQTNSNTYNGNGLTTAFDFNFYCVDTAWVKVYIGGVATAPSSIVLNINQSSSPGGTIHMAIAPPAGVGNVFIQRQVPLTQLTLYVANDPFPALAHMNALDKLTAVSQDLLALVEASGSLGLPTPFVPGDVLGALTPTTLAWVPQSGGSGGLPSMVGQQGHVLTNDGVSTAEWTTFTPFNPGLNPIDFGAAMDGVTDDAPGLQTTINAALPNPSLYPTGGSVTLEPGTYYLGQPLCITAAPLASKQASGLTMNGAGKHATFFRKHPTIPFQGPLVMINAPGPYVQGFTTGLIGGGQALVFNNNPVFAGSQIILNDSTAMHWRDWSTLAPNLAQFSFQTNLQWHPPGVGEPGNGGYIATSYGTFNKEISNCFGLRLHTPFSGPQTGQLDVIFKTENNSITLSSITVLAANTTYNVEISYDGAHVGLWVGGVLEASAACTGNVLWNEWETFTLGSVFNDLEGESQIGLAGTNGFSGILDSVRISNTARHTTGGGNFTPPTSKYAFDSNTLFLLNCDQGTSNYGFIIAQGPAPAVGGFVAGTPVKHYTRFTSQLAVDWTLFALNFRGFAIDGGSTQPCLINNGQILSRWEEIYIVNPYRWGVRCGSSYNSFYNYFDHFHVEGGQAVLAGFDCSQTSGRFRNFIISTGLINMNVGGATLENIDLQPQTGFFTNLRCRGPGGLFSGIYGYAIALDNEVNLDARWRGSVIFEGAVTFMNFQSCTFLSGITPSPTPIILYYSLDYHPAAVFENCLFAGNNSYVFQNQPGQPTPSSNALWQPFNLKDCYYVGTLADFPEVARTELNGSPTLVRGLSASNVEAQNLAGVISLRHGFTTATITFEREEPDTDYILTFQCRDFSGTAPAAGSRTVTEYVRRTDGADVTFGADPAGTSIVNFGWTLIRVERPALLDVPIISAVPSTYANPLASPPYQTGNWAIGGIIEPIGGRSTFLFDHSNPAQIFLAAGAGVLNADSWALGLQDDVGIQGQMGTVDGFGISPPLDAMVVNGELVSLLSPGPHHIAMGIQNNYLQFLIDGQIISNGYVPAFHPAGSGVQQTPIHVGEAVDASDPLVSANPRSFRVDTLMRKVIYFDPDMGPTSTADRTLFIGDNFTKGNWGTANGSFATQIAEARAPDPYCWIGARADMTAATALSQFWNGFGAQQTLVGLCVLAGFVELLGTNPLTSGALATDVWANLEAILTGTSAQVTMTMPNTNARAWAGWVPPYRGVPGVPGDTATCVINGITFVFTVTGTNTTLTDLNTLRAAILASGPTTALVTPTVNTDDPVNPYLRIDAVANGFAGNGIPTATDGAHGAYWYPGTATFAGANATLDLNGRHFNILFNTDNNTTTNDAVTLLMADGPTAALFTATNVGGQMLIKANAAGISGNTYVCTTNFFGAATLTSPDTTPLPGATHLGGGRNGAVQNGVPQIVLCTVPPFGQATAYNAGKETQRNALNTLIRAFVATGVTIADVDILLRDAGNHAHINPAYLSGLDNTYVNDAAHTALFGLIDPLLP